MASNCQFCGTSESIKIFDLKGNEIKIINDSNDNTIFIDSYYDKKKSKNYIITGNSGYIKSYDYINNKIYHIYKDKKDDDNSHDSLIISDKEEIIKIIDSCEDGNIRIWNFHSGDLINKIKIIKCDLHGICLWNNDYLFVGCDPKNNEKKKIKLIDLKTNTIIYLVIMKEY